MMQKDIQPKYNEVEVRCACGNTFMAGSTKDEIRVEICSECHPFYTGKQKNIEKGGRIDKFKKIQHGIIFEKNRGWFSNLYFIMHMNMSLLH